MSETLHFRWRRIHLPAFQGAKLFFWLGVALAIEVSLVSFHPGAEPRGCAIAAVFVSAGLFVSSVSYRIGAVCLLALLLSYGISGYHRGIEYQHWLNNQGLE